MTPVTRHQSETRMQTQISCPNCRTPYVLDIHQVVDVGQDPALKQLLLSGRLNLAVCPSCGYAAQLGAPLLYHDPAHELFMVYVPMELNLPHVEQQKIIGDLVQQVMSRTPAEKRRGYMLQPQTILSYQTFMEKVLETEGITPEMMARQRRQAQLLDTLSRADSDVVEILLKERADEIDETFFALLSSMLQASVESSNQEQTVRLTNLQARLYAETAIGKELEQRQIAMHRFRQEANKAGGVSPELLFKHIVRHETDEALVEALITTGQAAINYSLFSLMADEIERRRASGDADGAGRMGDLREQLLALHDEMQSASRAMMQKANDLLGDILQAPDRRQAIRERLDEIDEAFMYLLSATIAQAQGVEANAQAATLTEVRDLILDEAEKQTPPELRLLNQLMSAEDDVAVSQILAANQDLVTPELVQVLRMLATQAEQAGDAEATDAIRALQATVEASM